MKNPSPAKLLSSQIKEITKLASHNFGKQVIHSRGEREAGQFATSRKAIKNDMTLIYQTYNSLYDKNDKSFGFVFNYLDENGLPKEKEDFKINLTFTDPLSSEVRFSKDYDYEGFKEVLRGIVREFRKVSVQKDKPKPEDFLNIIKAVVMDGEEYKNNKEELAKITESKISEAAHQYKEFEEEEHKYGAKVASIGRKITIDINKTADKKLLTSLEEEIRKMKDKLAKIQEEKDRVERVVFRKTRDKKIELGYEDVVKSQTNSRCKKERVIKDIELFCNKMGISTQPFFDKIEQDTKKRVERNKKQKNGVKNGK